MGAGWIEAVDVGLECERSVRGSGGALGGFRYVHVGGQAMLDEGHGEYGASAMCETEAEVDESCGVRVDVRGTALLVEADYGDVPAGAIGAFPL